MADKALLEITKCWTQNTSAWFAQAEVLFALRDITADNTKSYYIVTFLSSFATSRMASLIEDPPAQYKYPILKANLKNAFGLSECERERQLLSLSGFGEYKS